MIDFTLPELGENITSGDVLRVLVQAGDALGKDQPVLELETDKATIEVPSSVAGTVKEIKVKAGDTVKVGQAILSVDEGSGGSAEQKGGSQRPAQKPESTPKPEAPPPSSTKRSAEQDHPPEDGASDRQIEEASEPAGDNRREKPKEPADVEVSEDAEGGEGAGSAPSAKSPARREKVVDISRGTRAAAESPTPEATPAPAAPSVRRMARELGVDINDVPGTGQGGRISIDDVKAHVNRIVSGGTATGGSIAAAPLPDFSLWGEIERQPMRGVRRKTAQHLASAWATIPHVTQHDVADVTALEELRKRYTAQVEAAGGNLTVTAILVKIVAAALKKFPQFNSSVDMAAEEIIYKKYVHIGIAVDTDRGLLVPVIRDADSKNVTEISVALAQLSEKARSRKLSLEEMQGGCFSVSNLGGIGGTAFTPIVNAPEVAVLGVSRARTEPVFREGQFVPRLMLPLSLSYDHRVIDGADGIRFLRWIIEALEQPFLLALQG